MGVYEKIMLFGMTILIFQLSILLLLIWRSKKTYLLIGYQMELAFWIFVVLSTVFINIPEVTILAPAISLLIFIRVFTNAIMYMGDPDKVKERWSFINDIERKNKE